MDELRAHDFAELAAELRSAPSVAETAEQVVGFARGQLDAHSAGITIVGRGGRLQTIAPTSPVVEEVDRLQYDLREGTCVDAAWEGETLQSPALASDPRWPNWGPKAAELGVASVLAVALPNVDGRRIGALNLYWSEPRGFSVDDVAFAHIFGRHAAVAMSSRLKEENLRVGLDTRKRIGQAQGILMAQYGLTEDQAFAVLRRYSQTHNAKLRDIAELVVADRALPSVASVSPEATVSPEAPSPAN